MVRVFRLSARSQLSYLSGKLVIVTAAAQTWGESGRARYTFRLRVSSTANALLLAEWDRCRWVWNECVAKSKAVHAPLHTPGAVSV